MRFSLLAMRLGLGLSLGLGSGLGFGIGLSDTLRDSENAHRRRDGDSALRNGEMDSKSKKKNHDET